MLIYINFKNAQLNALFVLLERERERKKIHFQFRIEESLHDRKKKEAILSFATMLCYFILLG